MKTKEVIIDLNIKETKNFDSDRIPLETGFIIGVEVISNHDTMDNPASIQIKDDSGASFVKKSHLNHWKRREGAGFIEGMKPLGFNTNNKTFVFEFSTKNPVTKDTYAQIILIYKKEQ